MQLRSAVPIADHIRSAFLRRHAKAVAEIGRNIAAGVTVRLFAAKGVEGTVYVSPLMDGGPQFAAVPLSTGGGVLSTIGERLVRLVRSGGPEFVPFLFPGFKSAFVTFDLSSTMVPCLRAVSTRPSRARAS